MTYEVTEVKSKLEAGLGKIDKTAVSSGTKVDQIESLVSPQSGHRTGPFVTPDILISLLKVETLREQIWELDTTNRNNLVFYGIREDGVTPEFAVKEVIRRSESFSQIKISLSFNQENWNHSRCSDTEGQES